MKILSTTSPGTAATSGPSPRLDGAAPASPAAQQPHSAQVELSSASRTLSAMQTGDGDIDMAKVEAIRAAIARGEISIDAGKIADGLLASARELLK